MLIVIYCKTLVVAAEENGLVSIVDIRHFLSFKKNLSQDKWIVNIFNIDNCLNSFRNELFEFRMIWILRMVAQIVKKKMDPSKRRFDRLDTYKVEHKNVWNIHSNCFTRIF